MSYYFFSDIQRLEDYHQVEHVNEIKRKAYETFWLLKHLTTISYRWKTF